MTDALGRYTVRQTQPQQAAARDRFSLVVAFLHTLGASSHFLKTNGEVQCRLTDALTMINCTEQYGNRASMEVINGHRPGGGNLTENRKFRQLSSRPSVVALPQSPRITD